MLNKIKGFSPTNLAYIRRWYLFYKEGLTNLPQVVANLYFVENQFLNNGWNQSSEIVPQLVAQIPWGHNREIITKCIDIQEAIFYVQETIRNNWSRAILQMQIESKLYQRQGKANGCHTRKFERKSSFN